MSDDIQTTLATLHDAFAAEKAELTSLLSRAFANPAQAAVALLSAVDEFGPAHAMGQLKDAPAEIDDVRDHAEPIRAELVESRLSRLVDIQDQLDELTRDIDVHENARPRDVRRIDIQGETYVLDGDAATLRRDNQAEAKEPQTYAEKLSKELGVPLAEPNPDHERDRTRGR